MNAEDIIIEFEGEKYTLAEWIEPYIETEDFSGYDLEIEENGYVWLMRSPILDCLTMDRQVDLVDYDEAYRYYCKRVAEINDSILEYNRNNGEYRLYPKTFDIYEDNNGEYRVKWSTEYKPNGYCITLKKGETFKVLLSNESCDFCEADNNYDGNLNEDGSNAYEVAKQYYEDMDDEWKEDFVAVFTLIEYSVEVNEFDTPYLEDKVIEEWEFSNNGEQRLYPKED